MDFAKKQLEKYGWSEGKGLGRNEDGISSALKPNLKFDKCGIGHKHGDEFTNNWWEKVFNDASRNIEVDVDPERNEVKLQVKSEDAVEITTKNYSLKTFEKNKDEQYGLFLKISEPGDIIDPDLPCYTGIPGRDTFSSILTREEMFAACGRRTTHKGARHGLKLSGKLSRLEKQEKLLLKKMKNVSLSDSTTSTEKKLNKLKKHVENPQQKEPTKVTTGKTISPSPLKKKSSKRKSVSFNETTITKYYVSDLDTSFDSEVSSIRDENCNEAIASENTTAVDEGIEEDTQSNSAPQKDHRSFEEAQFIVQDLSKAEKKKLLKKRKLEAKKNRSTEVFLRKVNDPMEDLFDKEVNFKKRKFYLDDPDTDMYSSKNKKKGRRDKQKKSEKQMNKIVKSLDSICRISE